MSDLETYESAFTDAPLPEPPDDWQPDATPPQMAATATDTAPESDDGKVSAATRLVRLALESHTLSVSTDGEPFAVPKNGPRLVRPLRGGKLGLRAELARAYRLATGRVAPQQALADALLTLEGEAAEAEPEPLALRVAELDGARYLDLGDNTGRAVRIDATGWQVIDSPPVLFRRTALTSPLPEPVHGGNLAQLWELLNVAEADRPLVAAWLVSLLYPTMPHPIPALLGEQGTGKTSAAKMLTALIDPSPVLVRKAPRDADSWVTAASGSWVVALDNLSTLSEWLSDTLCRAVTGDGDVRRQLYTDGGLVVFAFRRCVMLTGIDLGALRGDLADRLLPVDLAIIGDRQRREESELWPRFDAAHPSITGAVLDLAASVASVLPSVSLDKRPRMADYARILAAVDRVLGTEGQSWYVDRAGSLAADSLAGDPYVTALADRLAEPFTGESAELLAEVPTPDRPVKGWPTTARAITALLKRQAPVMRRAGWIVDQLEPGHGNAIRWGITRPEMVGNQRSRHSRHSQRPTDQHKRDDMAASDTNGDTRNASNDTRNASNAETATLAPTGDITAGHDATASVASVASDKYGQSQGDMPTRPCGHPGNPASKCGTCVALELNAARECAYCTRPALPGTKWCGTDDAAHQHARQLAGVA